MEKLKIEELQDLKVPDNDYRRYLKEPLLEYVWTVANEYCPQVISAGVIDSSLAPTKFVNRYFN